MKTVWTNRDLRQTLLEASQALSRLDADRLEEMAQSCEALIERAEMRERVRSAAAGGGADREFSLLSRILDSTESNLRVLRRLAEGMAQRLEYGPQPWRVDWTVERDDGDA